MCCSKLLDKQGGALKVKEFDSPPPLLWLKKHNTRKVQWGVQVNSCCEYLCPVAKLDLPKRLSRSLGSFLVEFLFCLIPALHTTEKGTLHRIRARCGEWEGCRAADRRKLSHTALRMLGPKASRTNRAARVGSKNLPVSSTHFIHRGEAGCKNILEWVRPAQASVFITSQHQSCIDLHLAGYSLWWFF